MWICLRAHNIKSLSKILKIMKTKNSSHVPAPFVFITRCLNSCKSNPRHVTDYLEPLNFCICLFYFIFNYYYFLDNIRRLLLCAVPRVKWPATWAILWDPQCVQSKGCMSHDNSTCLSRYPCNALCVHMQIVRLPLQEGCCCC